MSHHERVKNARGKNKKQGRLARPHFWSDRRPMLSPEAEKIVGDNMAWLRNAVEKNARLGGDGYSVHDCGHVTWRGKTLVWELRGYDKDMTHRDHGDLDPDDRNEVVFVLSTQEAKENDQLDQSLRTRHWKGRPVLF